ncbi:MULTISPECIES: AlkZ-related protein [unclassified Butyrivibrio]|uniref:AlkZ-related protein n=1 Tax=unclassified Butyrivibrio TaxID=2639466 RepID=UPI00041C7B35|nr:MULTISPECIES: hypothetical protein [unclassified Butyrivibrio]SEL43320.1 hypothetical protein SAMN04487770_11061 [Butyrivibrio sp. ob235]
MTFSDDFVISSMDDLMAIIDEMGFVPFFENEIEGFSIEEHIDPKCWYGGSDSFWDAWEWKGPVINKMKCAYGKFLKGKAMYISSKWFPDFANFRRDGYDFDARYDDGLASYHDKELFELIDANAPILSKPLKKLGDYGKGGKKGYDTMITRLQKQCYIITSDFKYATDKFGNQYGWGIAEYSTPEKFFGKKFRDKVYKRTPEESYEKILGQFSKILPEADEASIRKILK